MAKAKRIIEAAAWFCDGLPPETENGRDIAEMYCKAAMGRASTRERVKIGPLRWSELKPGDAGVPSPPTDAPPGVKLLHVEGTVTGPWKRSPKLKRAKQIEPPKPVVASSSRFGDELILEACGDGNLDSIRHLAEDVEGAVLARDSRIRAEEARIKAEEARTGEVTGESAARLPGEIADSEAGNFVYRLVRVCGEHGHAPPPELIRLVQTFTKQNRSPRGTGPRKSKDADWRVKAADHWQKNPDARQVDLARAAGVNRSTISKAIKIGRLRSPIKLLPVKE